VKLELAGTPGQRYRIEFQAALPPTGPWQVLNEVSSLTDSSFTVTDPATTSERYYRAVSILP
jgi:hypothetical protein